MSALEPSVCFKIVIYASNPSNCVWTLHDKRLTKYYVILCYYGVFVQNGFCIVLHIENIFIICGFLHVKKGFNAVNI